MPTKPLDLQKLLLGAQLPALPHSAIKVMELARDPQNGPPEFAVAIEGDPGLTGQVLRFVNSSYFGFSNEISNVKLAITLVGIRTVKNFALWSAVFSLMPNPRCGPFDLKSLWQDSLKRGLFARALAKALGIREAEEAFAAALLQDMAVPMLAKELPVDYLDLLRERDGGRRRMSELELERFGWTHAQAGGIMARQWRLPGELTALIEGHSESPEMSSDGKATLQFAVRMSALLPSCTDQSWWERAQFEQAYQQLPQLGDVSLAERLAQTDKEFAEFAPIFKLHPANKSLTEYYEDSLAASEFV